MSIKAPIKSKFSTHFLREKKALVQQHLGAQQQNFLPDCNQKLPLLFQYSNSYLASRPSKKIDNVIFRTAFQPFAVNLEKLQVSL